MVPPRILHYEKGTELGLSGWNEPAAIDAILAECRSHVAGPEDAQLIYPQPGYGIAISSDAISAGQAFPGEDVRSLVRRGLVEAVSDLAASGALFHGVQIDLRAPDDFSLEDFAAVGTGLEDGLAEVGGLLLQASNMSRGEFGVSFTVVGIVEAERTLTRSGAQPGDLIFVSGETGGWNAALALLNSRKRNLSQNEWESVRDAFVDYQPELQFGADLLASGLATACTDANDSLDKCLRDLVRPARLDALVNESKVPLSLVVKLAERELVIDSFELALTGIAGDNRLVFTANPKSLNALESFLAARGHRAYEIGRLQNGAGIVRYSNLRSRSIIDDDRPVSIYSSDFDCPIRLRPSRFGAGGRVLNEEAVCE